MNEYWAGASVREFIPIIDETQSPPVPADPTTITVKFSSGDKAITGTYNWPGGGGQIIHDSLGNFHVDIDTTGSTTGVWTVEVVSTGVQTSGVDQFQVNALPL